MLHESNNARRNPFPEEGKLINAHVCSSMVQQPFAFAALVRFIASARRLPQSEAETSSFTAESFVGEDLANVAALGCPATNC